MASNGVDHSSAESAFKKAFEDHSDELFRHARLRISDRERALELTQEAFLRTWEYVARGEEIRQYRSFLYRILNNLIIDEYRKRKTTSLDAMLENEETATAVESHLLMDERDSLEDAMVRFEAKAALAALERLPEQYRAVLVMRYVDGLSPGEIASVLSESENAVSVRIHRALRKLKDLLSAPQRL